MILIAELISHFVNGNVNMAKIMKKAQTGKNVPKGMVESEMSPGKMIPKSKSNYATGNYSKMLGAKPKAKVKPKAQDGLRTGQYKRLGRIDEKNPARAERVADRMKTKASRVERGMGIANPPIMRMERFEMDRKLRDKAKSGKQMLKRADGSYSQRGLWDNIRAAKGSGKKPTAAMLKQERKIKSKTK
jgi:hypothetical protein